VHCSGEGEKKEDLFVFCILLQENCIPVVVADTSALVLSASSYTSIIRKSRREKYVTYFLKKLKMTCV